MPYRKTPLVKNVFYHVFNRSVARQPIFLNSWDYQRAYELLNYYRFVKPGTRYSHFKRMKVEQKTLFLAQLEKLAIKQVEIHAYCLMPNHFHLLLEQKTDNGISGFLSNFQNSYARFFNTKNNRSGSVFQLMFKAVYIETDEQLKHVVRYIHLNPLTSYLLKKFEELNQFQWSSYLDYIGKRHHSFVETGFVLKLFTSPESFVQFTNDQISYQRELERIKHLIHE